MRYFDSDGRYNWVDENNVLVGYDSSQSCCENFSWSFKLESPSASDHPNPESVVIAPYRFDTEFFVESEPGDESYTEEHTATFRMLADGCPDLFLVLSNSHNGYYGHGFSMQVGGTVTKSGCL